MAMRSEGRRCRRPPGAVEQLPDGRSRRRHEVTLRHQRRWRAAGPRPGPRASRRAGRRRAPCRAGRRPWRSCAAADQVGTGGRAPPMLSASGFSRWPTRSGRSPGCPAMTHGILAATSRPGSGSSRRVDSSSTPSVLPLQQALDALPIRHRPGSSAAPAGSASWTGWRRSRGSFRRRMDPRTGGCSARRPPGRRHRCGVARVCAARLGAQPSCSIARSTAARAPSDTRVLPLTTCDTVARETPEREVHVFQRAPGGGRPGQRSSLGQAIGGDDVPNQESAGLGVPALRASTCTMPKRP